MGNTDSRLYTLGREAARGLLEISAVYLRPDEPFTWASGNYIVVLDDGGYSASAAKHTALIDKITPQTRALPGWTAWSARRMRSGRSRRPAERAF